MKMTHALPIAILIFSMLSIPCAKAGTQSIKPIGSRQNAVAVTKRPPPAKIGRGTGQTARNYYIGPRVGTGYRSYLPATSLSSVDISIAEVDPPSPPPPYSGDPGTDGDGPRGDRGDYP